MLRLVINGEEFYDESKEEFIDLPATVLELEHSLVSLSKWESKFQKPFLSSSEDKTTEEMFAYIEFMVQTPVEAGVKYNISQEHLEQIRDYIDSPESATTFGLMPEVRGRGETITSELIYYWMVAFNIPFEVENWHLNRLFALIRICNIKNSKPKSMSKHEIAQRNRQINQQRRAELGSSG